MPSLRILIPSLLLVVLPFLWALKSTKPSNRR